MFTLKSIIQKSCSAFNNKEVQSKIQQTIRTKFDERKIPKFGYKYTNYYKGGKPFICLALKKLENSL